MFANVVCFVCVGLKAESSIFIILFKFAHRVNLRILLLYTNSCIKMTNTLVLGQYSSGKTTKY